MALNPEHPRPMTVESKILGPLTVPAEAIIRFPSGLFGFPERRSFAFVPGNREGTYWLQSADDPYLAFVLVDPFLFFPGFTADLPPAEVAELGSSEEAGDVAVLAIVTLPASRGEKPTANLQGPLALNLKAQLGKQLALEDPTYGVRCEFELT